MSESAVESEIVAEGIIEAGRLIEWAKVFASKPAGVKNPLVRECKMHFNEEGIRVMACDSASVALVGPTLLSKKAFESYNAPGAVTQGVDLIRLIELVKPADPSTLVQFAMDMKTRRLDLEYGSADLSMGLIDPESVRSEPDDPDPGLPNSAVLTGQQINDAAEVASLVSDHVTVRVDPEADSIAFTTRGDVDEGGVEYPARECIDTGFAEPSEALYSLDYLKMLTDPMPADAEVYVETGHEFPIRFEWEAIEGHFSVRQTLAPRIQTK